MDFFASINNLPISISDSGKGDSVLFFLHGYLETRYIWEEFMGLLPDNYRKICIDIPGHGLSSSDKESNTMDLCASVVVGVMDKLHIEKATIIGHSMGGYIGQNVLKLYPDRVEGLIHFNSNPYADNPSKKGDRLKEIEVIRAGKLVTLAGIAIPGMYSDKNIIRCDDVIKGTVEICDMHDPEGIVANIKGLMDRVDQCETLNTAKVPVLFILGDDDKYLPQNKLEELKKDVPNAEYIIIPNTGHNSFIEEPKLVLEAFLDYQRKLSNG